MKYYIINKQEVKQDIWVNPIVIRTKCLSKINKVRKLQKQLNILMKQIEKDLYDNNAGLTDEKINKFIDGSTNTEITRGEYNSLLVMSLLDTQEQRIRTCNKTNVLKGKLYGNTIK